MIVLTGADLVLPDRILPASTICIEGDRIAEIRTRPGPAGTEPGHLDLSGCLLVPGFIDVHVHGVEGRDVMESLDALDAVARRLPAFGVTAFCPTTIACAPDALGRVLNAVNHLQAKPPAGAARVVGAHLESNFINPAYRGAQPAACLRVPIDALSPDPGVLEGGSPVSSEFHAASLLEAIDRGRRHVSIVTLAPELDGGLALIRRLTSWGLRVGLGHSAATYDQALAAVAAGARHATHLFNRMPPMHHREPGLVGAVLGEDAIAAEIICDGHHVHPAVIHTTVAAKGPGRVMAITDGTAAAGLPAGSQTYLGATRITAGARAAHLDDGTLAGSIGTMDAAFRLLVRQAGQSLVDAVTLCATTPARELGLVGQGVLAVGALADLVVLDRDLGVMQTYIGGEPAFKRRAPGGSGLRR